MSDISMNIDLIPQSYPKRILDVAGMCSPGNVVTLRDGLEAAINISIASPKSHKMLNGEYFPDGPFGCVRFIASAKKSFALLDSLRELDPSDAVSILMDTQATVVSLGWNCVNMAGDENVYSDPTAHGEMVALRLAGRALPVCVAQWPDRDIVFIEATSAENCAACHERNTLWGGTVLSVFAFLTREVLIATGFNEGEACHVDNRSPNLPWVDIADLRKGFAMSSAYVPGYSTKAATAFSEYSLHQARIYQPDYSSIINAVLRSKEKSG